MEEQMRLQKYLAAANVASRRASETLILDGRVTVNGQTVTALGTKVRPDDQVCVDGKPVKLVTKRYYIMLNKPAGYVTTAHDEQGRKTVFELVGDIQDRLFSVGRLDADTEGLLLLTNDGDFTYQVTHPRHEVEKTYLAYVKGIPDRRVLGRLQRGVELDGRMTAPAQVEVLEYGKNSALLEIKIHEGRNRQVRRMLDAVGHRVITLKRTAIGGIVLGNLPLGRWRHLTQPEVDRLLRGERRNAK